MRIYIDKNKEQLLAEIESAIHRELGRNNLDYTGINDLSSEIERTIANSVYGTFKELVNNMKDESEIDDMLTGND